jgi:hypothetical protein
MFRESSLLFLPHIPDVPDTPATHSFTPLIMKRNS